jgi:hypothetical protein
MESRILNYISTISLDNAPRPVFTGRIAGRDRLIA